ncbi:MAG: RagB/SusD family nutrient uptake outer membrane protein [Duncaniella sp.]|nr:RagB/SusD family nutrient uptake outer membrane protein [Duncaniella sp.]
MNKRLLYILFAPLMLLFSACDDYLDIQPVGKVIPTTVPEFRSLITEAYSTVPSDRGLASFRSDEITLNTSNSMDVESYSDIWIWNDNGASENTSTFSWRQFYHVLFIANYIIESENSMTGGTHAEVSQLVGEAYMLRAYMHFLLANLHAPAYTKCDPAVTKAVPLKLDSDVEATLSRSMLGDVYASVIADLDEAEKYLNVDTWESGYNYRFNTLSVDALRSRVYLYMGEWDESLAAASRVLAVRNGLDDVSVTLPNSYQSVENIVALEQVFTSNYEKAIKVDRNFYAMYTNNDLRRRTYFNQQTASNVFIRKGGSNTYSCSLRVGEMYLNAAESAWQQGEYTDAADYLLTLQKARFNDAGYALKETAVRAMTSDQLIEEIYTERARELAFEGHRWFDLRRTTQPRIEKTFKNETYVLEQGDSRYTIPIPSAAIEANPSLAN